MSRVHSKGQLICWDDEELDCTIEGKGEEDERENKGEEGGAVKPDRAMTDSSESFVCINDEEVANKEIINEGAELVINKEEGLVIKDHKDNESDDDW